MTMGQDGMGEMGEMAMKIPPNSVPMVGSPGPYGYITMGACTPTVKVRQDLGDLRPDEGKDFSYGGWYENPPGTQAISATEDELHRDLGGVPKSKRTRKPMHHSTTGEGKRDESLFAREALKTSNDC
jgi:manganese oxidase